MTAASETARYEIPADIQDRLEDRVKYFMRRYGANREYLRGRNHARHSFEYGQSTGVMQAHEWFLKLFGQTELLPRASAGHTVETAPIPAFVPEHRDELRERHEAALKDLQEAERKGQRGFEGGLAAGYHYGINEVIIELGLDVKRMRKDPGLTS